MAAPVIDGYRDLTRVGRGGFATVYRAHQERFGRVVAVKVIEISDLDPRAAERFERECRAMGGLSRHPNVVAVHDAGTTHDGQPWLAMEYLEAGSLADRLAREGPLSWSDAVAAVIQVAGALDAAHAVGTLHRDLKPQNLLVGDFGEIKLSDFGLAIIDGSSRTTTGRAAFTLSHVAPEILRGHRPDERTDLYGLGSTLHTLITGQSPFGGDQDEAMAAVMMRVLENEPRRLDGVPDALADLTRQLLAKEPADRPASAAEVGRALQAVQAGQGLPVTELSLAPRPDSPPAVEPESAARRGDPHETIVGTPSSGATTPPDPDATIRPITPPPTPPLPAPPPPSAPPDSRAPELVPERRTGRRWWIPVASGVILLALIAGVVLLTGGDDDPVTLEIDVGGQPAAVAVAADRLWVSTTDGDLVPYDFDGVAGNPIEMPFAPDDLAVERTTLWAVGTGSRVVHFDAESPSAADIELTDLGEATEEIAAGEEAVWVSEAGGSTVKRLALDGAIVTGTQIEPSSTDAESDITTGEGAAWVASGTVVAAVEPSSNGLGGAVALDADVVGIAAGEGAVWATSGQELVRIDPETFAVETSVGLEGDPTQVVTGLGSVWVATDDGLVRVDPETNQVVDTIDVGDTPKELAIGDGAVWVGVDEGEFVARVEP